LRLAVVGKGGAGKSVIAGTLARLLARRGERVLALDSDLLPGLALSLGAEQPAAPPLAAAAERDEDGRWRLKKGIGPVRAVRRYATAAPDGVLLLQCGKVSADGLPPIMGAVNAYYRVVHRLPRSPAFRDWSLVGDLPAGPRQTAFGWAPYADTFVLVVEPTVQSVLTARRIARIVRAREGRRVLPVANKMTGAPDRRRVERQLGEPLFAGIPADEAVAEAERRGVALVDHAPSSRAARALGSLTEALRATLAPG
jgi:CO dehydrogenase maturation factor